MVKQILATVYLTYLLTQATLLDKPRERVRAYIPFLDELFACPYCMGLWAALLVLALPKRLVDVLAAAGGNLIVWRAT